MAPKNGKPLWPGAVVRWTGTASTIDGARIEPGDMMRVVDPGRFGTSSYTTLVSGPRRALGDRVLVVTTQGQEVKLSPHDLETQPADHPLGPESDATWSDWFTEQLVGWPRGQVLPVASVVPPSFEALAVVLHPWQRTSDSALVSWAQVAAKEQFDGPAALGEVLETTDRNQAVTGYAPPTPGELPEAIAAVLVNVLAADTTTFDDVFVAVWDGWGDLIPDERFPGAARIRTPGRDHVLLRGPLDGVRRGVRVRHGGAAAGLWWPLDRRWFVATEIDLAWTFVAGSGAFVDALHRAEGLETLQVTFDRTVADLTGF